METTTKAKECEMCDFWTMLNQTNLTEIEYLDKVLGPKYLPMKLVAPLTLAYVTIFITGIFGNVATCIVIVRNSSMQTATNYYLFSLAISDLILLMLGLPNELSVFWQQYPWALGVGLCKIRAYVSEMSSYVSVLTIVAFSMERYLAICHPLRLYTMSGLKRPIRFILAAWSIALISAIPFAVYTNVNYVEYPPGSGNYSEESAICGMLLPYMPKFPLYELSCTIFFFVPMIVILVVYVRMGLRIRSSTRISLGIGPIEASIYGETRHVQSRKTIVRMLSTVVLAFFLCWAPFHAQRLLYVYAQDTDYYPDLNEWLYILSGCLYYFSTTVNPILYNLMSARYRAAFKETLCCRSRSKRDKRSLPRTRDTLCTLCRCSSSTGSHVPSFRCSVRSTVDHTKEIFGFDSNRRDNGNADFTRQRNCLLAAENGSTQSFLNGKNIVAPQSSNDSSISRKQLVESLSTASSVL